MEVIIVEQVRFTDACNKVIKDVHNTKFKKRFKINFNYCSLN